MNEQAKLGAYLLLGAFAAITATCKAIEWANYQMKVTPKAKLR